MGNGSGSAGNGSGGNDNDGAGSSGGGFASNITGDANRYDYSVDRTTNNAGFKLKPEVLGGSATVSVDYSVYRRDGNKFVAFLLDGGGSGAGGSGGTGGSGGAGSGGLGRWRGINRAYEPGRSDRVRLTETIVEVAYEVSHE